MAIAADQSQRTTQPTALSYNDVAGALNTTLDTVGRTILQAKSQQYQYNMMMLAYKNQEYKPQFLPAKYFPQCAITPAQMDYPEHACENINTPADLQQAEMMSKTGFDRTGLMDQMLSDAQNSIQPVGLQCLKDAKSKQLAAMEDKINNLKAINNNLKKNNQLFRDQNKNLLESMKAVNDELTGSKNSSKADAINLSQLFEDPACSEVLTANSYKSGLRGVRDSMTTPTKGNKGLLDMAKNMAKDEASIKNQIKMQTDRIAKAIQNQGAKQGSEFLVQSNELTRGGLTKFPAVSGAITRKYQELMSTHTRIKAELEKDFPGYKLPELDKHFATNIGKFSKDASGYFKKKMIDDCVTMKDKTGLGLSRDQILNSLRQKTTDSSGTTTKAYRTRLNNILNSDAFIEDKLAAIKALDTEFGTGNITLSLVTESGTKNYSPYAMFQETIARCEARYAQDNTYSKDENNTSSQADKVAQAQKYIVELRDLEKKFANDLATEISDELINCTGKAKERSGTCDADRMDISNENFCVSSATTCSNNIRSCYQRAENYVKAREDILKTKAAAYNQNVVTLVAQQELVLKQIQTRVFADAEFFKNYFPDSNWKMPDDLFVKLPELSTGAGQGLGAELLRGGGTQDFLENLPAKIESLVQVLDDQKIKIAQSIDTYINAQKAAMDKNRSNWKNVAESCFAAAKGYRDNMAQAQAKAQADRMKEEGDASQFCSRYSDLAQSNPAPGCAGSNSPESLYTDMTKVSAYLDPSVQSNIAEYKNLCSEIQSEKTSQGGENEKKAVEAAGLNDLCQEGGDWEGAQTALIDNLLKNVPKEVSDKREEILKFINGEDGKAKLSEIVGNDSSLDNWKKAVMNLQGAIRKVNSQANKPKDICAYADSKMQEAISNCRVTSAGTATKTYTEIEKCEENLSKRSEPMTSELKSLNAAVKKITSESTKSDILKRWSEIGERFGGACKAGAGSTYSNRFLGEFQKGLGTTTTPGLTGGLIQGI